MCRSLVAGCWCLFVTSLASSPLPAQTHLQKVRDLRLDSLVAGPAVAYYSERGEARARAFASVMSDMLGYFEKQGGWRVAPFYVAVLSEEDWRSTIENPYGVPGVRLGPVAFVPTDVRAGAVYIDAVALRDSVKPALLAEIDSTCGTLDRCVMDAADAIILHELGHIFERRAGIGRPAVWLSEVVAHYFAYAYMRERQPSRIAAWMLMHRLYAAAAPRLKSLDEFEAARGLSGMTPLEYGRFQALFLERVEQVYARQGLGFITKLAAAFPRQERPTGCPPGGGGICDSYRLENREVLRRLEAIEPGFVAWADSVGQARH
jgi:hypothetical protein